MSAGFVSEGRQTWRFSANTGFLWKERPFLERIGRAGACGFDAVEFHDEAQGADPGALADALGAAGLSVVGLNARMGDTAGCAAIPGQETQARRDVDAALAVAGRVGAGAVHVLSGRTEDDGARAAYVGALRHALDAGEATILIEPICRAKMPGYFMNSLDLAAEVLAEVGHPRLRILFDCFHVATEHGDVAGRFARHAGQVGHVQVAGLADRGEPGADYARLLPAFRAAGYDGPLGCEYAPAATVEAGLGWRDALRGALP